MTLLVLVLVATGIYVLYLAVAVHNLVVYIIKERRYKGPSVQLAIFYALAIPFLVICIGSYILIAIKGQLVLRLSEILNLIATSLLLAIGANYALMMN